MTKRATPDASKPGTERHRDEQRSGGPRMHGEAWHDEEGPRDLEKASDAGGDAVPEAEGGPDTGDEGDKGHKGHKD